MFVMPQASIRHAKMQDDRMPYRSRNMRGDKLRVGVSLCLRVLVVQKTKLKNSLRVSAVIVFFSPQRNRVARVSRRVHADNGMNVHAKARRRKADFVTLIYVLLPLRLCAFA